MSFKETHPADIISRVFMLEYMRELKANYIYEKVSPSRRQEMFYTFESADGTKQHDFNWEYLLFAAPMENISSVLEQFLPEIEVIDAERNREIEIRREMQIQKEISKPVDINLMSVAKAAMEEAKDKVNL